MSAVLTCILCLVAGAVAVFLAALLVKGIFNLTYHSLRISGYYLWWVPIVLFWVGLVALFVVLFSVI